MAVDSSGDLALTAVGSMVMPGLLNVSLVDLASLEVDPDSMETDSLVELGVKVVGLMELGSLKEVD